MAKKYDIAKIRELYINGDSFEEVALKIGCHVHTVSRHVHDIKRQEGQKGSQHWNWKGGLKGVGDVDSYVYVYAPGHPMARGGRYVKRADLVLAEKIGRFLTADEVAHHKNSDRQDDSPENLELKTRLQHQQEHLKERTRRGDFKGCHKNQSRNSKGRFS